MFRIGLSGGQSYISLRDELEHARCYIEIQRDRLDQEIQYDVDISATIKGYYVPKIILQPFIENSMRHGYPDEYEETIHIRVTGKIITSSTVDCLAIEITDNGVGFPPHWQITDAKGIGIRNIQERIWMYFGSQYGVECTNRSEGGA